MYEDGIAFTVSARQAGDEIPSSSRGVGVFVFDLLSCPKDGRLGTFAESVGIKQSTVVVVAQQIEFEIHALFDALTWIGPVADDVAEAINVINLLAFDVL